MALIVTYIKTKNLGKGIRQKTDTNFTN